MEIELQVKNVTVSGALQEFCRSAVKKFYRSEYTMDAPTLPYEIAGQTEERSSGEHPVQSPSRFPASYSENVADSLVLAFTDRKALPRPKCLLATSSRTGDGEGAVVPLDQYCCKLLVVTLGITDVMERSGLTVSIWGSQDQTDWGSKPLVTFRQRQYCGVYSVLLNMAMYPDVRYLRAHWSMNRWGKGDRTPLFGFEVFLEESGARISGSAVA